MEIANWITAISTLVMAIATIIMAVVAWQAKSSFINEKKFDYLIKFKNKLFDFIDYMSKETMQLSCYSKDELKEIYVKLLFLLEETDSYFFPVRTRISKTNAEIFQKILADCMLYSISNNLSNEAHLEFRKTLFPKIVQSKKTISKIIEEELQKIN